MERKPAWRWSLLLFKLFLLLVICSPPAHADLLWQHQTTGTLSAWLMNDSTLTSLAPVTPGVVSDTNWKIVGVGDFDNDGNPDLLWQHQTTGTLSAWLMHGTSLATLATVTPSVVSDTNWKIVGIADFNNDGKPDLLWQHQTTGTLSAWLMDGTTLQTLATVNPGLVSDTNWKIVGFRPAVISGTVKAPGGTVAFYPQPTLLQRVARFFSSSADAALSGISSVANGTVVELVRIDNAGNTLSTIATTTVTSGTYSLNLTNLHAGYSSDLVVQVRNQGTGAKMRAFVTSPTVNIDPISEALVRAVLEKIAATPGTTLNAFTVNELSSLASSMDFLTTTKQAAAGANLEAAVTTVKNLLAADPSLTAFLTAAAAPGQTTEAPGDVGNYFPMVTGDRWNTSVTVVETGQPTVTYADSLEITGTQAINGIQTTVFTQSNPSNTHTPQENYLLKNSAGVTVYGNNDPSDTYTPQLVPYQLMRFPLTAGSSFEQMNRAGLDFGEDLDGDGINERCSVYSVVTVAGFETVAVAAGTFPNSARIETRITITVTSSRYGISITETVLDTTWFAPDVGQVKEVIVLTAGNSSQTTTYELTAYGRVQGVDNLSFNVIDAEYSKQLNKIIIVSSAPSNQLHIYDPNAKQDITVNLPLAPTSVSVGPDGLFAAVGHNAYISYVNLSTGELVKTIPVSANVFDVVLAGNGYVYVFPRIDQWVYIHCVEIATNIETLSTGMFVREQTRAKLHPGGTAMYGAQNGLSPGHMEKYGISGGTAAYLYDYPYHGQYEPGGNLWISQDGSKIFTRGGYVFKSSIIQSQDMVYDGALENLSLVKSLDHSSTVHKIAVIPDLPYGNTTADNQLWVFNDDYTLVGQTLLPMGTHGMFIFYNDTGIKTYVIVNGAFSPYSYGIATY